MRIAIIGPTHPYKGGIAQHTTELAHHLQQAGNDVTLVSWKSQYPFFYPGAQFVPDNKPELPLFSPSKRVLSWKNPLGWLRLGRQLRGYDQVIFAWWVPTIQGPVYLNILKAVGKNGPKITIICHNAVAHKPRKGDKSLTRAIFGRADRIITHTDAQAKLASQFASKATEMKTVGLPLILLGKPPEVRSHKKLTHKLVFFGFIRPYKGVDVLLRAVAEVPSVKLHIAGEFWGGTDTYRQIMEELGLDRRVTITEGYVPSEAIPALLSNADALVLPYKTGTASWNVTMAHAYGLPVIATSVGSMPEQINDGVDGLLCKPDDVKDLSKTIKHFYSGDVAKRLTQAVPSQKTDQQWQTYLKAIV
ncbi:MAG: glycosyltransferase family 4 protein [Patescibacteria group bacterium]